MKQEAVSLPGRPSQLQPRLTRGAQITSVAANTWRLEIPAGPAGRYRLAQLDDYSNLSRHQFLWQPPFNLRLSVSASAQEIPGTWGFGLWNDPFSMALLSGGRLRLPALPDTAWFFFASPPNYLSLRDDLPACGGLAATFRSPGWPSALLAPGALALPLLAWPPAARWLRRVGQRFVQQDAAALVLDAAEWHAYRLEWTAEHVCLQVDGQTVLHTPVTPCARLGLVIWIDNQYAATPPSGRFRYGTLPNPEPAWIEIRDLFRSGC